MHDELSMEFQYSYEDPETGELIDVYCNSNGEIIEFLAMENFAKEEDLWNY